jgi:hypothetical protein
MPDGEKGMVVIMPTQMFPIADFSGIFASVLTIMPRYEDIPADFRQFHNKWVRFFSDMFYVGIKIKQLKPKDGIDAAKALRHLRTIAVSFEPKHEHKEAAVAYLASQWFDDIEYEKVEGQERLNR